MAIGDRAVAVGAISAPKATGSATQTLTPALFTNTQTFYAPTVSGGTVTLTPSLVTNSQTFYAPTVSATYALTPGLVSNAQTFYGPAITQGAAQIHPLLFTNNSIFYGATLTGGIPVVAGPTPAGRPSKDKKPSKRKRRPVIVSVDGEDFVVNSEAEAEDLILAAREAAEQKAKAEAEEVVRKRQAKAERGSRLNTMPIRLDRPEVQVSSFADQRADPKWIRDLTERFTEVIDSSYEQAARNAEVAVLMKAQAQELDEEDQLVALLFTL